jgi:peptidoglycan/LPS O-acetylase OafA/YrhL
LARRSLKEIRLSSSLPRAPEIDGLRSLAIVPVVLYHAGWSILPGGFVGVDIFFVISGYLITRILDSEIAAGGISLSDFYERRARRIMPALFVMVAACIVAAVIILLPEDLVLFGRSLVFTILFGSNVYFYKHTGYFDAAADSYAMLHTWSLAVEEQFYLVFPLVLMLAASRFGLRRWVVVAVIATASFVLSVVTSPLSPAFAFYLPFTRVWELMAGSLLALGVVPAVTVRLAREILSILSLAAIIGTILLLREDQVFPGWVAAFPVLGAAGLIHVSSGTWAGRMLSLRLLVGIGLISYSLYLWHWPLLVFGSYQLMRPLTVTEGTGIALLAVVCAVLSWRYVERPFRRRTFLSRNMIFAGTGTGIAVVVAVCTLVDDSKGAPGRLSPESSRLAAFARDYSPKRKACHDEVYAAVPPRKSCVFGAPVAPTLAVWSDSHGVELAYALGELAGKSNRAVVQLSSSACPPGVDFNPPNRPNCAERNREVLDFLLATPAIDTVILAAYRPFDSRKTTPANLAALEKAVAALRKAGKTVVLVYPDPDDRMSVPQRLARQQMRFGRFDPDLYPLSEFRERMPDTLAGLDDLVSRYQLVKIDPTDVFCPKGMCMRYRDGKVMLFDDHHPSLSAERMLAPLYADLIARSGG